MQAGDRVRLKANPGRIGILGHETDGPPARQRMLVNFLDGTEEFFLPGALEKVEKKAPGPYELIKQGRYGRTNDLRGAITYYRLSGKLANLIYSMNSTNTEFLAYQFKPVLQFLDSPTNGILIADEVGLGKTIEAGLIWTELQAREDARRLLVVCPAMLCDKWKRELAHRFGVKASIVDAHELLQQLEEVKRQPRQEFALIASLQGIRPPRGWNAEDEPSNAAAARLARLLDESDLEEPLIDMVIIDEAHYLRNQDTQTYRLGALLRPAAQHMVMLSATPIQMRNRDLFNLVHLLDEDAFPYEQSFEWTLRANAPIVDLRDRVLGSIITQQDFVSAVATAQALSWFEDSEQLTYLRQNPPSDAELSSPRGRAEIADQLDRVNPLSKVVTRTLKRDVQINRVERLPVVLKARMSAIEESFYNQVTAAVQDLCEELDISEGFLLTIPQRQMASSMAAACEGWKARLDTAEELQAFGEAAAELDADIEDHARRPGGTLLNELRAIAHEVGDAQALAANDSKFELLHRHLAEYWRQHPGKKVVLFSFYRATLYYLQRRLARGGVQAVVLHGGMDKQQALEHFERPDGPHILLSSEVASEGVDLQFSSLLINYDLPWNPAKIEQRIGRIDRIGQQEEQILIWNLVYEDSIDDRVYERLLERLGAFRQALGSMEAVLGEEMRKLAYELLSHRLTPEQINRRIDSSAVAIERKQRREAQLESEAANLIAHGEYIQNKVRAADEVGRYIRGEDLLAYVRDFFLRAYAGTRLVAQNDDGMLYRMELATEARVKFADFIQAQRLQGRTTLLASNPLLLRFDNRKGKAPPGTEIVGQDHPLVRFVGEQLRAAGSELSYHPVAALELHQKHLPKLQRGAYLYVVMRWSVSGSREIERLEYIVRSLDHDQVLDGNQAEQLVNTAALKGSDWLGAADQIDPDHAAFLQDECRTELDERFRHFVEAQQREDADRIRLMVGLLEQRLATKSQQAQEQIQRLEASSNPRRRGLIPAVRGRLQREANRVNERIAQLRLKTDSAPHPSVVSAGVIRIS